ncbi:MAG TPA: chemotaxis protein CheW [Nitrospiria bacterium]|nr:chemotaxis protein CheW [Nitrospiria bacterium]
MMQSTEKKEKQYKRQLVNFRINNKDYALDIIKIIEIISFKDVTPIPKLPTFIEGVVELRGLVIPVIDLKKRLGLTLAAGGRPNHILIVKIHGTMIGIIVDEVREVIGVEEGSIQSPPEILKDKESEYLMGICKFREKLVLVLDIESLFTHDEKNVLGLIKEH